MTRPARCLLLFVVALMVVEPGRAGDEIAPPETFDADRLEHWAYQPLSQAVLPAVRDRAWPRNPIDAFILAGIEEMEFTHAPPADPVALVRRLSYDLTGLPPTPEAVDAFLHDSSPMAYENLVDRLLASPCHGERWAQHWLDLAHYAESNGFELDAERPDAWRYRDWVVNAINNDMPYDRFVTLQIAGDEAEPGNHDALIATGFGRSGPREVVSGNIDPVVKRQSELTEITGTVGSVFLGLTMGCARCHDHKFDALPTTDYYRLQSFFAGANLVEVDIADQQQREAYEQAKKDVAEKTAPFRAKLGELEAPYRKVLGESKQAMLSDAERQVMAIPADQRTPVQKKMAEGVQKALTIHWEEVAEAVAKNPTDHAAREELKRAIHEIEVTLPRPPAHAMAVIDETPNPPETVVYRRGDPKNHGPHVAPRPPGIVLAAMGEDSFEATIAPTDHTPGRRIALARWLTRPDNPLTARVIVNRLWQHHFGQGIVATSSDFGVRGEAPSHPELLDWLAGELIRNGWRLKPIHRLIVTSATYRQSSAYHNAAQARDDPDNTLVWRQNRRRLDAESVRDALLTATGELKSAMGGPGVLVPIEPEVEDLIFTEAEVVDLWPETPDRTEHARRSLYLFRKRNVRYPMFDAFDAPDTQTVCTRRPVSTHALQALVLLNSRFALDRARALAGRVLTDAATPDARIDTAYRRVLGRSATDPERQRAERFLVAQAALLGPRAAAGEPLAQPVPAPAEGGPTGAEAAAWVDLCQALLNCNEFLFVP